MLVLFSCYIVGWGFFEWYAPNAKSISYGATFIGLAFFVVEEIVGYKDMFQRQFNIIGKLTIAVNSLLFALNFQGLLTNPVLLLLALYISVAVISIGVCYNLKKYEYI